MLGIRQKSINIDTVVLLAKLKENLASHQAEYAEAVADYRKVVALNLKAALQVAENPETSDKDILNLSVSFSRPSDYSQNYIDAIEMLEYSEDKVINLDQESFKAYVKNEWSWTNGFRSLGASLKAAIA